MTTKHTTHQHQISKKKTAFKRINPETNAHAQKQITRKYTYKKQGTRSYTYKNNYSYTYKNNYKLLASTHTKKTNYSQVHIQKSTHTKQQGTRSYTYKNDYLQTRARKKEKNTCKRCKRTKPQWTVRTHITEEEIACVPENLEYVPAYICAPQLKKTHA